MAGNKCSACGNVTELKHSKIGCFACDQCLTISDELVDSYKARHLGYRDELMRMCNNITEVNHVGKTTSLYWKRELELKKARANRNKKSGAIPVEFGGLKFRAKKDAKAYAEGLAKKYFMKEVDRSYHPFVLGLYEWSPNRRNTEEAALLKITVEYLEFNQKVFVLYWGDGVAHTVSPEWCITACNYSGPQKKAENVIPAPVCTEVASSAPSTSQVKGSPLDSSALLEAINLLRSLGCEESAENITNAYNALASR